MPMATIYPVSLTLPWTPSKFCGCLVRALQKSQSIGTFSVEGSMTFKTLVSSLFVEQWLNSITYSTYYRTCAPNTCQYTFIRRQGVLFVITTFLPIYGGLILVLRLFVANIALPICRCDKIYYQRHRQVRAIHQTA